MEHFKNQIKYQVSQVLYPKNKVVNSIKPCQKMIKIVKSKILVHYHILYDFNYHSICDFEFKRNHAVIDKYNIIRILDIFNPVPDSMYLHKTKRDNKTLIEKMISFGYYDKAFSSIIKKNPELNQRCITIVKNKINTTNFEETFKDYWKQYFNSLITKQWQTNNLIENLVEELVNIEKEKFIENNSHSINDNILDKNNYLTPPIKDILVKFIQKVLDIVYSVLNTDFDNDNNKQFEFEYKLNMENIINYLQKSKIKNESLEIKGNNIVFTSNKQYPNNEVIKLDNLVQGKITKNENEDNSYTMLFQINEKEFVDSIVSDKVVVNSEDNTITVYTQDKNTNNFQFFEVEKKDSSSAPSSAPSSSASTSSAPSSSASTSAEPPSSSSASTSSASTPSDSAATTSESAAATDSEKNNFATKFFMHYINKNTDANEDTDVYEEFEQSIKIYKQYNNSDYENIIQFVHCSIEVGISILMNYYRYKINTNTFTQIYNILESI